MTNNGINSNRIMNQEQKDQDLHQDHQYNYNNYNIHTEPGVLPPDEAMQRIAEAYKANINPTITQVAAQLIEEALKNGMEPATIILAIEETGMANRPSPYYLRAVLKNWAEFGVVFSRRQERMIGTTNARPWWK